MILTIGKLADNAPVQDGFLRSSFIPTINNPSGVVSNKTDGGKSHKAKAERLDDNATTYYLASNLPYAKRQDQEHRTKSNFTGKSIMEAGLALQALLQSGKKL